MRTSTINYRVADFLKRFPPFEFLEEADLLDRHTAAGDGFITGQVFQRLLQLSRDAGRGTFGAVTERVSVPDRRAPARLDVTLFQPLRKRNFRLLWLGETVSLFGDYCDPRPPRRVIASSNDESASAGQLESQAVESVEWDRVRRAR